MESVLHGTWGERVYEVDAANRPVRLLREVPPINGFDVQLTIDLDLQQYAEQALQTTLEARRTQTAPNPKVKKPNGKIEKMNPQLADEINYKAPAGSVVIYDFHDGSVLAMASYPSFDPRWFEAGLSSRKFSEIFPSEQADGETPIDPDQLDPRQPCRAGPLQPRLHLQTVHRVRRDGDRPDRRRDVPPGQRDLPAGVGREPGRVRRRPDPLRVQERHLRRHEPAVRLRVRQRRGRAGGLVGHVLLPHRRAHHAGQRRPARSCRSRCGCSASGPTPASSCRTSSTARCPTGPSRRSTQRRGVISEDEGQGYFVGDNVQLSIGQGLLSATPMQLTVGYATLANQGFVYQPKIVKAIWNPGTPDGEPGFVDLDARLDLRGEGPAGAGAPDPDAARDPQPDRRTGSPTWCARTAGAAWTRTTTTRPPARTCSSTTRATGDPDRREDRHGPGREQLPLERLVGLHRVQPRSDTNRSSSPPTSRSRATARRPRRRS